MTEYPLKLEDITNWFASKQSDLDANHVVLVDTAQRTEHIPSARADYDTKAFMGRIAVWVTGQVDFEVLQRSDAELFYFHHESISSVHEPRLQTAFTEFLRKMNWQ
jgi:hypothetical protein